jgi:hypothetical protein
VGVAKPARRAVVTVTAELLTKCLGLPDGARVVDVGVSWVNGGAELLIEAAELPLVGVGQVVPRAELVLEAAGADERPRVAGVALIAGGEA